MKRGFDLLDPVLTGAMILAGVFMIPVFGWLALFVMLGAVVAAAAILSKICR